MIFDCFTPYTPFGAENEETDFAREKLLVLAALQISCHELNDCIMGIERRVFYSTDGNFELLDGLTNALIICLIEFENVKTNEMSFPKF